MDMTLKLTTEYFTEVDRAKCEYLDKESRATETEIAEQVYNTVQAVEGAVREFFSTRQPVFVTLSCVLHEKQQESTFNGGLADHILAERSHIEYAGMMVGFQSKSLYAGQGLEQGVNGLVLSMMNGDRIHVVAE